MNLVFFIIITFSLLTSTVTSIWILKKKENKWEGLLAALCINTLVLAIATIFLYKLDVQTFHKQTDGLFGSLGIGVLIFFIPINTFINNVMMEIEKKRSMASRN